MLDFTFPISQTANSAQAAVDYIYFKQLEEAEILVVNKVDLLKPKERKLVVEKLEARFPGKPLVLVSVRTGEGLEPLFEMLLGSDHVPQAMMEVDDDFYVKGARH